MRLFYRGYVVRFRLLFYGQAFCVLEEADLFDKQNVTVVDDFDYACLDARLRQA